MASILGKIAAIFLMPLYTNNLTQEEYGAMALIISVSGIIDLVSNLNIHSGIARDYYEEGVNRTKLVSTGFISILALSITIMIGGFLTKNFWCERVLELDNRFIPAFTVMLLTVPAGSLMSYFSILTRYKKKPIHYSVGTILQLLIQISISVIGVVVCRAGIVSIFWGLFAGYTFSVLFFAFLNRDNIRLQFDKDLLRRTLLFAIPTLPAILAGWLDGSMGQILIGKYVSMQELGVYSVALSLASVFTLISTALQNVWGPFLFENYKNADFSTVFRRLFIIMSLVIVIVSLLFSVFSHEIVLLLSNEGYLSACRYMVLLCVPMGFFLMFPFASSGVQITRDTKYIGISYIAGSCLNLLLLLLTIKHIGVIAVPICLAFSRIMTYFILYKASEKKTGYYLPNYFLVLLLVITLFCYFAIQFELSFWIRFIFAAAFVVAMAIFMYKRYVKVILKALNG